MNRFALMLSVAAFAAPAFAQPKPATAPTSDSVSAEDFLLTISLHNQRLDAVVKQISQASGANVLLVAPGIPENELPTIESLELKDVGIRQALAALIESTPETVLLPTAIGDHGKREHQRDVYMIRYSPQNRTAGQVAENQTVVKIYNLSEFKDAASGGPNQKISDLLSLIDVALAEVQGKPAELKFHQPTNTLIVKGGDSQQAAVSDVIVSQRSTENAAGQMRLGSATDDVNAMTVGNLSLENLNQIEAELQQKLDRVRGLERALANPTTKP